MRGTLSASPFGSLGLERARTAAELCAYRRIAALIKRERRSDGGTPVSAKVYRLMKEHGLLLTRCTGRRRPREHDGRVVTLRSNIRWCSNSLEFNNSPAGTASWS